MCNPRAEMFREIKCGFCWCCAGTPLWSLMIRWMTAAMPLFSTPKNELIHKSTGKCLGWCSERVRAPKFCDIVIAVYSTLKWWRIYGAKRGIFKIYKYSVSSITHITAPSHHSETTDTLLPTRLSPFAPLPTSLRSQYEAHSSFHRFDHLDGLCHASL